MERLDIHNPEHSKAIQEILKQGAESPFWNILCQYLQEDIDSVDDALNSDYLKDVPATEYKIQTEIMRNKKIDRQDILTMPEDKVNELENPDFLKQEQDDTDPYDDPLEREDAEEKA